MWPVVWPVDRDRRWMMAMDAGCLARIDDLLTALGAGPLRQVVKATTRGPTARIGDGPGKAEGLSPWRTEGIGERLPPTPAQDLLIDKLIEAQQALDVERLYVVDLAVCRAKAYQTNRTIRLGERDLSLADWYHAIWVATIELAKVVKDYLPPSVDELASVRWKQSEAHRQELWPLVDQALVEWTAQLEETTG